MRSTTSSRRSRGSDVTAFLLALLLTGLVVAGLGFLVPVLWAVALVLLVAAVAGLGLRAGGDPHWYRS